MAAKSASSPILRTRSLAGVRINAQPRKSSRQAIERSVACADWRPWLHFACESVGEGQRLALGVAGHVQAGDAGAGTDLCDREDAGAYRGRQLPGTGRQRCFPAGHPEVFAGNAGHSLGLRVSHRRLLRDRSEPGRRDFARRRRLRHQLRRAPDAHEPQARGGRAAGSANWSRNCSAIFPADWGAAAICGCPSPTSANASTKGAHWAVEHGFGESEDLDFIEEHGQLADAEPSNITERALERGKGQLGSLGSGNHFLEVQVVEEIFHEDAAEVMGLFRGQITVMIHCGSRGFGYQVCDDYLEGAA